MATHLVCVRLTDTELQAVEQLVTVGYYRSRSHLFREALIHELMKHKLKSEALQAIRVERLGVRKRRRNSAAGQSKP